jgi:hypothetical protein
VYAGGNPWYVFTAFLAELFHKGASPVAQQNFVLKKEASKQWQLLLKLSDKTSQLEIIEAVAKLGNGIFFSRWKYIKNDNRHINEQIPKQSGKQTSGRDLTLSYVNILTALHYRNIHVSRLFESTKEKTQ